MAGGQVSLPALTFAHVPGGCFALPCRLVPYFVLGLLWLFLNGRVYGLSDNLNVVKTTLLRLFYLMLLW